MSTELMIEVKDLKKAYGTHEALKGISFGVPRGEVLGFLGPNGAGKTTTMKILTCYMASTSGKATVSGHDVGQDSFAVRQAIGYLPEDTPIYQDLTTLEFLQYVSAIRKIEAKLRDRRVCELSEVCGLDRVLAQPIGELSKGFRQRVGLAMAMIHDPQILILDEPTSGLDPNQIVEIRELIKRIGREKTVILSTHILPEVQATCGRVIIIADGKLVADGTPDELAARDSANTYRVVVAPVGADPGGFAESAMAKLGGIAGVSDVSQLDRPKDPDEAAAVGLIVAGDHNRDLRREIFSCVRDNSWVLLEMQRQSASLEDVFRKLTRE